MFRFSKAKKKKLQEATVNKFFASWLRGWCDGIVRGLVPKKPKHRRLRGDWSLKNLDSMADSSEKVSFRVDMQCTSMRAEAFLVFDSGPQPTLGQQITDMLSTVGRLSANCWQHVGNLLAKCWLRTPVADCWQNIFVKGGKRQSADSFLGELFFTFSHNSVCSKS